MDRTGSHGFETPLHRYGRLESALGAVLGADEAIQRGPLRGRLKRISTLGLPEAKPGKGSRRLYSMCEASQLLICLLLEDAGLDPVIVVPAVKFSWPQLRPWVETASANQAKQNPMLLHARIRIVTGPWEDKNPASAMPQIGISPLWGPIGLERGAGSIPDFLLSQPTRGWHAFRNLTAEMLKLEQALHSS